MLTRYLEPFTRLIPVAAPDGLGGAAVVWQEGGRLSLAAVPLRPKEDRAEDRPVARKRLRLYFPLEDGAGGEAPASGDWLLRECTGERLRITGDARFRRTPRGARIPCGECEAEVTEAWEISSGD